MRPMGVGEIDACGLRLCMFRDAAGMLCNDGCGLLVAGEVGSHGEIVGDRDRRTEDREQRSGKQKIQGALDVRALRWYEL